MHDPQRTISAGSKLQGQPKSIKRPCTPQTMPHSHSFSHIPASAISFSSSASASNISSHIYRCSHISTFSHCTNIFPLQRNQLRNHWKTSPDPPNLQHIANQLAIKLTELTPDTFERANHLYLTDPSVPFP